MLFSPYKACTVEYVSLWDPAVDDDAMSEETIKQYVRERKTELLPLRQGKEPVKWLLSSLDRYTLAYATATSPDAVEGGKVPVALAYHLCQCGIKGVSGPVGDAPEFALRKVGLLEKVDDDFVRAIPPEVARELAGVIYDLSTMDAETKKNSSSRSGVKSSKSATAAKPAEKT